MYGSAHEIFVYPEDGAIVRLRNADSSPQNYTADRKFQ